MSRIASAPARINLLGEHVDHQGGTVLPVAVDRRTTVTYTPGAAWSFSSRDHEERGPWLRYVEGVIEVLADAGHRPQPGRLEIDSAIPEGRGLSSSAALEVAVAGALCDAAPLDLARLCRQAENEKVGVPCGIMDQLTAACAIAGHVLVLDCAEESFFHLPLPDVELRVFDFGLARHLADTPYAERRAEAAAPDTPAARHVAAEKERVRQGIEMLDTGDIESFGRLLYESHASLRDLYRCSHPVLDDCVERLRATPGVHGARMVGGGWGGCVLAVVAPGTQLEDGAALCSDDGLDRLE
ncbi:MAG: galactokinase [Planctomycetota bacterium]|jgi:galactokinase